MPRRRRNLDDLVRLAAAEGQLAAGVTARQVQFRLDLPASVVNLAAGERQEGRAAPWTEAEDEYLRRNLGWMSEAEIAGCLGRTCTAVHLRWKRDLQLPPPTKMPGCLTTQKVAETMGVDPKVAMRWVDEGRLRGRRLPLRRTTRSVRYVDLKAWALRPANWIYFRPERVTQPHLRRLLVLKASRWGDEWLTPGGAARLRGVDVRVINNALHAGKLEGVKHGNWHLLRSEVLKLGLHFFAGKGGRGVPKVQWSETADAFIVLATAVGCAPDDIAALMGGQRSRLRWTATRVAYRLATLKKSGRIPSLIRKHHLKVKVRRGQLFADWKSYQRHFPRLARAMASLKNGRALCPDDQLAVRRVLRLWAFRHRQTALVRTLSSSHFRRLGDALKRLRARGADPFGKPR